LIIYYYTHCKSGSNSITSNISVKETPGNFSDNSFEELRDQSKVEKKPKLKDKEIVPTDEEPNVKADTPNCHLSLTSLDSNNIVLPLSSADDIIKIKEESLKTEENNVEMLNIREKIKILSNRIKKYFVDYYSQLLYSETKIGADPLFK